jgi:phosphoglycolate phosphatase (TIGR01487 family)
VSRTIARARAPARPRGRALRALVTDVDGTLTDERRRLDPDAVALLRGLEERGIPVVLATGNVLPIALAMHRSLGLTGPIVAENGGLLYDRVDGAERVERLCDRRPALAALRRLRSAGLAVTPLFTDRWRETEVALEPTVALSSIRPHLVGTGVRAESTGFAIHLMQRGGGKLPALRTALGRRGLSIDECVAAGDGDNDVPMLRAAGYSVSFANGSPAARRAASYVARHGFARGFVDALKQTGVVDRWATGDRR